VTDFAELVFLSIIGRILIYLWMEFPLPQWVERIEFIRGLHECSLCSGTWGYTILFLIYDVDILQMLGGNHIDYIGGFIGGAVISFIIFLITQGYRAVFETVVIE
jgi:hypothetical protein